MLERSGVAQFVEANVLNPSPDDVIRRKFASWTTSNLSRPTQFCGVGLADSRRDAADQALMKMWVLSVVGGGVDAVALSNLAGGCAETAAAARHPRGPHGLHDSLLHRLRARFGPLGLDASSASVERLTRENTRSY
jgi:hypothetical protein